MTDPVDPLRPRRPGGPHDPLDPVGPLDPFEPRDPFRPRPIPWTPFGPGDNAQPDPQQILDANAKLTKELEDAQRKLTGMRDGPGPDGTPPVVVPVDRADGQWPFLLIRYREGDVGARPLPPNEIWPITLGERDSPDILLVEAGPATEPAVVGRNGSQAVYDRRTFGMDGGQPYDVWVHVWNLGRTPATGVRVRVFLDPAVGPDRFLGGRQLDLGDRLSETAHLLVKAASFVADPPGPDDNSAFFIAVAECLADPASGDRGPGIDRHVAHRSTYTSFP